MSKIRKYLVTALVIAFTFSLCACGDTSPKELTNVGEYEDCILSLDSATTEILDSGENVIKVTATYTNNANDPLYAYCSFGVKAFQNDIQLDEVSDINGDEADLIREIKNGQSISVTYVFKLSDDSEVEVLVCEPTADSTTIAKQIFLKAEE